MNRPFSSLLFLVLMLFTVTSWTLADDITSTFKVSGNCGMCKKKIETALRIKGVKKVDWDMKTHDLSITYNPDKITIDEIHSRIAAVGYDTDKLKADDAAYGKLDDCCKYEREKN